MTPHQHLPFPFTRSPLVRRQERSVLIQVDHKIPLGCLKATTGSSSSSGKVENKDMDSDGAGNEEVSFDQNSHLRILNDNLKRFSGKSLLQHMKDAEKGDDDYKDKNSDSIRRTIGEMMDTSMEQDAANAWNAAPEEDDIEHNHVRGSGSFLNDNVHMSMRFALLSHGAVNGMDGPVHNYANFAALSAFSYTRQQILRIPACRMAAPGGSDQATLSQIYMTLREQQSSTTNNNILQNHQGVHCTQYLQRFLIRNAIVSFSRSGVCVFEIGLSIVFFWYHAAKKKSIPSALELFRRRWRILRSGPFL
jgi:MEKHLA domain